MKVKINIKHELKIGAVLVVLFGLIAFTERMKGDVAVRDIQVKIENLNENHFLEDQDILSRMQVDQKHLIGVGVNTLNFKSIEKKIKLDPYIKDAQLYSDLKGNVTVKVKLRRPIARMVRNDGPDGYIAEDGTVMPVSEKFTSRVILISGGYVKTLLRQQNVSETEAGKNVMTMLNIIRDDEFWKAQIAELDIDGKTRISIIPQVGDEKIEFGRPEKLETKFKKLRIYYKEILPRVGWNKYNRVNLEYEGQIVAE
jgi:cell division protein FtsQ